MGPPRTVGSLDGTVLLHIDPENEEYWIEAKRRHDPKSLCMILTQADWWGLEVMDEDECESEVQENGSVRIYLAAKPAPIDLGLRVVVSRPIASLSGTVARYSPRASLPA